MGRRRVYDRKHRESREKRPRFMRHGGIAGAEKSLAIMMSVILASRFTRLIRIILSLLSLSEF